MKKCFYIGIFFQVMFSQYKLPFASQNNTIEPTVVNAANIEAGNVTVEIINPPMWLKFANHKSQISNLKSGETSTAHFKFSIDKSAPVGKTHTLQFVVSSPNGEQWKKEIPIQVSAPERFELFQNYPNPFNPSTTISYLLPVASTVSLKVFDIVGREIATLYQGTKEAGEHHQEWRNPNVATGMYICQLSYQIDKGKNEFHRKKMIFSK